MKLSVSNIGWTEQEDEQVYALLAKLGFCGVEAAPTRIRKEQPYLHKEAAAAFASQMHEKGFCVPSMQSIWFGRTENIFGTKEEKAALYEYTCAAIAFSAAAHCPNLVFGCPKNRNLPQGAKPEDAAPFFREIAAVATAHGVVLALEANPAIYNTNFLNTTEEAFAYADYLGCNGIGVNLDFGTIVQNKEDLSGVAKNIKLVSHVHISEPFLAPIEPRLQHKELATLLCELGYDKFVSLEMRAAASLQTLESAASYLAEVFG